MKKSSIAVIAVLWTAGLVLVTASSSFAAATATTATGGTAISADKARIGGTGSLTTLTGPALTETDSTGMPLGSMILNAPAGFEFDTTANAVTVAVTGIGVGTDIQINTSNTTTGQGTSKTVTATASNITIWVTTTSINSARSTCTWSGIKVRPVNGTPLVSSNITYSGTSTGIAGGTNMGALSDVAGAGKKLMYTTPPAATNTAGSVMASVVVQVQDQFGNTVSSNNVPVAVALSAGSFASGTTTINTGAGGVSTFSNLVVNTAGSYTLTASATGFTATPAAAFTVIPGSASSISFQQGPPSTVAVGATLTPAITVKVADQFANVISNKAVAIALAGGGTISGTLTQTTATTGLATFNNLSVSQVGAGKTLIANVTSPSLLATSTTFTATPGAASKLVMKTEPSATATAGTAFTTQPAVFIEDSSGNVVTNDSSTVTVGLATGSGPLQGTLTATAINGVATFANVADNKAESITLQFTDGSLTAVTSGTTIVVSPGAITHYTVTASSPQDAGVPFNATVTAQDSFGNTVNDNSTVVTLSASTGNVQFDSNGDGTFGDNTKTLSNGTFTIRTKDNVVETITITATAASKTGTSASIVVNSIISDWKYRKAITINHAKIPNTDQANFPVLINVTDTNLAAHARADGHDLLFTASDGSTVLSYEREKYTNTTGALTAWVKVPTLSHSTDTVVYLYYGNTNSADHQDVANAWDSNFKLVYHLSDAGPTNLDSTANGNLGTQSGGVTFGATGQVALATTYANGSTTPNEFISATSQPFGSSYSGSYTYRMWVKVTSFTGGSSITDANNMSYFLDRTTAVSPLVDLVAVGTGFGYQTRYDDGTGLGGPVGGIITNGSWAHVEMVRDYNTAFRLYVNGIQVATTADSGSKSLSPPVPKLGRHATFASPAYLNGSIDEFRISGIARSADWIQTEYNNESSPSTFYSVGTEQSGSATAVSSSTNNSTYGQSVTFAATVTGLGTPTGSVQFQTNSANFGSAVVLSGGSASSAAISTLAAGNTTVTAIYIPTGGNSASTGTLTGGQIVNVAPLGITATNDTKTYGQTKTYGAGSAAFSSSGLKNSETIGSVTITASGGTAANAAVNTYTLTPSAATGGSFNTNNYSITYNGGTLTVTPLAVTLTGTRVYNATTTAAAGILTVTNNVGSDNVTVASGSGVLASANVGSQSITSLGTFVLGGTAASNYTLAGASGSVQITSAPLTITANSTGKTYGQTVTFAGTEFIPSGLASGDTVTSVTLISGGAAASAGVAGSPYSIVPSNATGTGLANYGITYINGTLTVGKLAVTGHVTASDKTYDGNATAAISGYSLSGALGGDDVSLSGGSANFNDKTVGNGKPVTATGLGLTGTMASNYSLLSGNASTTASINALSLVGSITASDKAYDGNATATISGYSLSGVVGSDNVSLTGGSASFNDKTVGNSKPVTATGLGLTGSDAGNYALPSTSASTTASITAHSLVVSASASDKVYDATTGATVTLSDNRVSGDSFSDSYTSASFADKNAAIGKTVSVTGIAISGTDAANYTANTSASTTATITPASVSGSVTASDKVYDGTTTAAINTYSLAGAIGGDDVSLTGGSATFADQNVSSGATIPVLAVNSGGPLVGDFLADTNFFGGDTYFTNSVVDTSAVTNPAPMAVYQTERFGNNFTYTFGGFSTARTYLVRLHFVELYWTNVGQRVFNVSINGSTVLTNFDIIADAGTVNTATIKEFTATANTNGQIVIQYAAITDNAKASAIEIASDATLVSATGLTLTGADANNYTLTSTTADTAAAITPAPLTVTADNQTMVYGTAVPALTASYTGFVTGEDTNVLSGAPSLSTTVTAASPVVGSPYTITISNGSLSAENYSFGFVDGTLTVTAAPLTGSITASDKTYDGNATATINGYSLSGVVGSDDVSLTGGSATFNDKNVANGKPVSASGLTLTGTNAANYSLLSDSASTTASINARSLAVSATGVNKTYDGTPAASVSLSDDRVSGDSFSDSYTTASFADKNAAIGKTVSVTGIAISGTDAENYTANTATATTATIIPAPVTGSITASDKVYDGTATATINGYSLSGVIGLDSVALSGGSANFFDKNVGLNKPVSASGLGLSGGDAGNYALASASANTTATISAASLSVTADNKSRPYGQDNPPLTASYSGFASGDDTNDISGAPDLSTTAVTNSATGGYPISTHIGTLSAANYNFALADGTLSVGKAVITVTADDQSRPYGAANPVLTVAYTGFLDGDDTNVIFGLPDVTTIADTNSTVAAGPYTIAVTNGTLVATNYDFAFVSGSLTVTPVVVTVTADNQTMVYGTAVPALTASYTGFVNSEDTNVLSGAPGLSTDATATSPVVGSPYTIVATNGTLAATGDNYSFAFANGTLAVTPASVTGNITASDKTYDGNATAAISGYSLSGALGGDDVSLSGGSANFNDKTVGNGKPVTATGLGLTGTMASNYSLLSGNASTTASINALSLVGSITASDKAYDGNATATISGYSLSGVVGSDNVSLTGGSASFNDKTVGNSKPVTATGLGLTGSDAGNYALPSTSASTTASITAHSLVVSASASDKVYDATTGATVTLSDNRVSGDSFSDSYTSASFADKNAAIGKTVSVTGIAISGTDAANYTANTSASTTATITPASVSGSVTASDKVYDGTTTAAINTYSLAGAIGGDDVSLTGGSATFADQNVSSGATIPVLAVNSGGPLVGDFLADTNFFGGDTYFTNSVVDTSAVTNPAPMAVYQTERFGNNFTYTFGGFSTARTYLVRLHFVELYWTNVGQRVFNVSINGSTVLTNFDIIADAGTVNTATIKEFTATANTNGQIVIQYAAITDNAKASAIEIASDATLVSATGLTLTGADANNYTLTSTTADTAAAITPAPLTVTADNQTMVYGTAVPALTASYTGFVTGEDTNVLSGAPSLSTTVTAASPVVGSPYTITISNGSLSAENYSFGFVDGTLTVTAAPLTGSITASDKTYDGNATATINGYSLSGVVGSDDVSLTGGSATFNDKNVANGKPVSASGLTLTGTNAANYSLLSDSASTTASINARSLAVSATGVNKTYDGTPAASVSLSDDRVSGDSFSDSYTTASFADKNAAIGKTVSVTGIAISGTDAENYTANTATATTATIIPAPVTGSITASDKVYDGTATATINGYSLSGVIGLDSVALSGGSANFFDKNVGLNKPVSASGLGLSGGDAGNYALASASANTTATISAASLSVTADNKSKTSGLPNPQLTASYNGFVNGEDPTVLTTPVSLSTTATDSSPAGIYPIAASNGVAPNYTISYFYGTLTCVTVPALTDVHLNGSQYTFSFVTLSTELYQVEYKTNMTDATWTDLGSPMTGTGGSVSATNSVSGRTGFFRVEVMPGQ